jgi:hypothetical protein
MSEESEGHYQWEQQLLQELDDSLRVKRKADSKYWTTIKGETLLISKMETGHIKNCIRMVLRKGKVVPKEFYRVLESRGEKYDLQS